MEPLQWKEDQLVLAPCCRTQRLERPRSRRCEGKASWPLVSTIFPGQRGKLSPKPCLGSCKHRCWQESQHTQNTSWILLIPAKIMFWPLCLERNVWNGPVSWLHNLHKSFEESSRGWFPVNISLGGKKEKEQRPSQHHLPLRISLLHYQMRAHRPQNEMVEWPQCGSLTFRQCHRKSRCTQLPPCAWHWAGHKPRPHGQNGQSLVLHKWPAIRQPCVV